MLLKDGDWEPALANIVSLWLILLLFCKSNYVCIYLECYYGNISFLLFCFNYLLCYLSHVMRYVSYGSYLITNHIEIQHNWRGFVLILKLYITNKCGVHREGTIALTMVDPTTSPINGPELVCMPPPQQTLWLILPSLIRL